MVDRSNLLKPNRFKPLILPSGRIANVGFADWTFDVWTGASLPKHGYGKKAVLDIGSEPMWAELAILKQCRTAGWHGCWVDSYRNKRWRAMPTSSVPIDLPPDKAALLEQIWAKAGRKGGAWDVMAWLGERTLFVESKRLKQDRIQSSQKRFLEAALDCGLTEENFLVVEWTFKRR